MNLIPRPFSAGGRSLIHTFKMALAAKGCKGLHSLVPKASSAKFEFMTDLGFEAVGEVTHEGLEYHLIVMKIDAM